MTNEINRIGRACRMTSETNVEVKVNLDGEKQNSNIDTSSGFFNHMLKLFAYHAGFNLEVLGSGDTEIDDHHLVEDVGLVMGQAFKKALGDKSGINRYADIHLPMDEALVLVVTDISGRPHLTYDVYFQTERVGSFELPLIEEFLKSFVNEAKITLHVRKILGKDSHHIAEAIFKGLGRCLNDATTFNGEKYVIPSTKGTL
ncbi:imidazoleglycerol-phosphate dehydratase HisB [Natranaerobius trueperi]|uniref:Imidazoleglycerol-phosphate dehydratase n=1 Tax=Natranaerobius trueperi TaxID=759412 RepID=A0A226BXQ4_9FIRM|nr:imidazoleglycerol-phosphate dehydratase HisB [Natranaerobius trueperi]OWZ83776.1 imidazoleglycerol-phosphate dehydratase [Natranaerobius trueperi]